ncbi:hypothetical protein AMATHDRAFT_45880 [Amanita thiersii Skay4041]|uniref:SART-1 protein n=1 Tax=Amanita thiersii Skay4041 TaxID=703135 RepID=A0A2A9NUD1_9AGAR|nr:hypothetical protein AMATHDRAFT_45880 [Amanita thiersii Skay4041]
MSMEESISLEETNKIRISLGLKPLTEDKEPANDKQKQAEDNYAKLRQREAKEREAKSIADGIANHFHAHKCLTVETQVSKIAHASSFARVRNRRELNASLKGATLGEVDGDVDDALKWLKRSKKKEKELARKRQEELESMDKVFQQDYTERDLEGLKVSHDFDELNEGEARILTLKDSRILDNEEDELQNIEMAEEEKTKKNQELKIKRRDYTGYDDDEFVEGTQGMKRAVLAKYDEFLEGPKEMGFRLGSSVISTRVQRETEQQQAAAAVNKSLLTIDYVKNLESSDYLKEGDIGFKKPKVFEFILSTKKKRPSRRAPVGADEKPNGGQMDIDEKPIIPVARERNLDANFVDDEELQAALARSRRAKLQRGKKLTPDQLAQKIAEQRAQETANVNSIKVEEDYQEDEDESGLTFDDTSEFVRTVGLNPIIIKPEPKEASLAPMDEDTKPPIASRDVSMAPGDEAVEELEAGEVVVKDEEDEEDEMAMLNAIENAIKSTEAEEAVQQNGDDGVAGTSTEQTYSTGMASTLNILRKQGILAQPAADQGEREKIQLQRDLWLAEQRRRVARRDLERMQSRGGNKDQAQREYENRLREQQDARENLEAFKNYKPDVNIVYYDEFGRELTPKEAWKALSHKFHGKGSGKMKTEKRLKKIAEEKKQAAMASGDTPLSMNRAFQQRQEKTGQAHFVLSVGNRGAVPQDADFLEVQPLAKGKTEKQKKKKESKNAAKAAESSASGAYISAMPQITVSNGASPTPTGQSHGSASASPTPRPGFSRISSAAAGAFETPVGSQSGTPVSGEKERSKVAFGFGMKRKAGEEAVGSPPAKRR